LGHFQADYFGSLHRDHFAYLHRDHLEPTTGAVAFEDEGEAI